MLAAISEMDLMAMDELARRSGDVQTSSTAQRTMLQILHRMRQFRPYLPDSLFNSEDGDMPVTVPVSRHSTGLQQDVAAPLSSSSLQTHLQDLNDSSPWGSPKHMSGEAAASSPTSPVGKPGGGWLVREDRTPPRQGSLSPQKRKAGSGQRQTPEGRIQQRKEPERPVAQSGGFASGSRIAQKDKLKHRAALQAGVTPMLTFRQLFSSNIHSRDADVVGVFWWGVYYSPKPLLPVRAHQGAEAVLVSRGTLSPTNSTFHPVAWDTQDEQFVSKNSNQCRHLEVPTAFPQPFSQPPPPHLTTVRNDHPPVNWRLFEHALTATHWSNREI